MRLGRSARPGAARRRLALAAVLLLALTGCGQSAEMRSHDLQAFDVSEPPPAPASIQAPPGIVATPSATPAQIAYTYGVGYTLADGQVAPVQTRHAALCNLLGPTRCRIGSTRVTAGSGPGRTASGQAVFFIEARRARLFLARLDALTDSAGGTATDRRVESEDLTKAIVDTDARVRAKQALADRLVAIIRTSTGNVGQLVEAERAYADAQEELDSARQTAAMLRGRVAMSQVTIDYTSTAAAGALAPVATSLAGAGETLAGSVATLISFVILALPWALLLALLVWIGRRRGWRIRWPWRRRDTGPAA